jgi:hypothetical protein
MRRTTVHDEKTTKQIALNVKKQRNLASMPIRNFETDCAKIKDETHKAKTIAIQRRIGNARKKAFNTLTQTTKINTGKKTV